jgi:hypothetical protein
VYCELEGDAKVKKHLTRTKVALIAAEAYLLMTAIDLFIRAVYTPSVAGDVLEELVYVVAHLALRLPFALICFGLVYGILRAKGIDGVEAKPH